MHHSHYVTGLLFSLRRSLDQLADELGSYSDEALMWKTGEGISNSAGNLALHVLGNLNHFIGAGLGRTTYRRDRPLEFSGGPMPRADIIRDIHDTARMVTEVISGLDDEVLDGEYPIKVSDEQPATGAWLFHIAAHLAYHLGQINYHRRLLDV